MSNTFVTVFSHHCQLKVAIDFHKKEVNGSINCLFPTSFKISSCTTEERNYEK